VPDPAGHARVTRPGREARKSDPSPHIRPSMGEASDGPLTPGPLSRAVRERGCRAERGRGEG